MHSSNQSHFAQVPRAEIPRAKFKRDSNLHTTLDAGNLVPIFVDEVLPGDTFIMREHMFGRLATPLKPLMDNMYLDTFYFFVPSRLVWDNFQKFHGEQKNPGDSTDFTIPIITLNNAANQSVYDYLGLPTLVAANIEINALPLRAMNLIWNEWFRDQNLQDSLTVETDNGPDLQSQYTLLKRGKRHDYFTSCLPFPQKGADVLLPLGATAPIKSNGVAPAFTFGASTARNLFNKPGTADVIHQGAVIAPQGSMVFTNTTGLQADLSAATSATINAIREAFQIQRLFERDARGGSRYTEIIRSHFGVTSPDSRLQRPEYLGGSSQRVGVTPVANTTGTVDAPQGELSGIGTVGLDGRGFTSSFTEHGYILGFVCLRADLNYQQGLNKMWSRQTRFDFYYPALAHLGEQAVLNKEIYAQGTPVDEQVFGYQERFAEYKYKPNLITGKFRSNDPQSLDIWHLAQDFSALPTLSADFIVENPPIDRVIAVPTEPHLILDCYFDLDCVRPMPMYSVPGLVDHF